MLTGSPRPRPSSWREAIPFCLKHEQAWEPGCTECAAARPVHDMLEEHQAVHAAGDTWPLWVTAPIGRRS